MTFNDIKDCAKKDAQAGLVEIIDESEKCISLYDGSEFDGREITITNPEFITQKWIEDKIVVTPSVKMLDVHAVAEWIFKAIHKDMLLTLNEIIFIGNDEEDFDYLSSLSNELYSELECSSLPGENQLGIMWWEFSKILVNVGSIVKSAGEMVSEGSLEKWERRDCINYGVLSTIAHELRHLAQANPYLPEDILQQNLDDEADAEAYAQHVCAESNSIWVMKGDF